MSILDEAAALIDGDRQKDYGAASENLERIAAFWRVILKKPDLTPGDVALCMCALKIARLIKSPNHHDSLVDACGYLALVERTQQT
jgi:hypothetical protein